MMPDASHWRSSERYAPVEQMSASGIAWEWLRRSELYNQDYEALSAKDADPVDGEYPSTLEVAISR
jgi:hypothetical protein